MRRAAANAGALAAALTLATLAFGQESAAPVTLKVHSLKKGSYWVEGGSSNTAFLVGTTGVVILDTQRTAEEAHAELAEIGKITPNPVDAIIVSHSDPGNVGALPFYPRGTPFIAQENVRSTIQSVNAGTSKEYPAPLLPLYQALADFPPTHTVAGTETMQIDGFTLVLMHTAPAHTGNDLAVYVPAQKWVFAGDIINTNLGAYPIIHRSGSSLGWIASMHALLALDADIYIPGHGPIEPRAWLASYLQATEQRREQIKVLFEAHKSLEQIKQALPETLTDPRFPSFAQTVYEELEQGYPRS